MLVNMKVLKFTKHNNLSRKALFHNRLPHSNFDDKNLFSTLACCI